MKRTTNALIIAIALLLAGVWAYNSWVIAPEKAKRTRAVRQQQSAAQSTNWAYVAKEKEIAPGEIVKLLVISNADGLPFLDTKCLIYTNQTTKTSTLLCPDAAQDNLDTQKGNVFDQFDAQTEDRQKK